MLATQPAVATLNTVTLTNDDMRTVKMVTFERVWQSVMDGRRNTNGGNHDPFTPHLIGALGECAFAKWANLYWDGSVGRFAGMGGDVGAFQVRARRAKLPMIIRPLDSNDDYFIHVYMTDATYRNWCVAGWISGRDGKRLGALTPMQGGPRYLVNENQLRPMEGLIA